jgi:phosphoribosyl-AMP cyclohydrolase
MTRTIAHGTMADMTALPAADLFAALVPNADGLVPAIAQQWDTGQVLMLAWMNAESLQRTLDTGQATYWSRSRQQYWAKGETSGNTQLVTEIRLDCDGDALLLLVDQQGPACHTGLTSCFETASIVVSPAQIRRDQN